METLINLKEKELKVLESEIDRLFLKGLLCPMSQEELVKTFVLLNAVSREYMIKSGIPEHKANQRHQEVNQYLKEEYGPQYQYLKNIGAIS